MSTPTSSSRWNIPAQVMAKLQAAYQASGPGSTQGCPDPETVISYALEELIPEKRGQVYAHLSECKDCLDLVLDLRFALAETQAGEYRVRESAPTRVQPQSWLAGLLEGMSGLLPRLVPLRRLIPAAVALVVLVIVGIGVFHHLTASTSGQPPLTMTKLKPGPVYNHQVCAIDKAGNASPGVFIDRRSNSAILPLLLGN